MKEGCQGVAEVLKTLEGVVAVPDRRFDRFGGLVLLGRLVSKEVSELFG